MAEREWVQDRELEAAVAFLGGAVAGLPDARSGEPIGQWGIGGNAAGWFQNEIFAIRDYCWCDGGIHAETVDWRDNDPSTQMPPSGGTSSGCPMNFEHFASGIRGTWYKHLGRDMRFSRKALPGEALDILLGCLVSIGYQRKHTW
ncbi:hypothetical protein C8K30_1011066 [Promicromonospora sp. AC04]|uniref:hypothetical protein n=1 Tax=Promicromonospora sp. AC04 TaxID=2135723 RepID=UPI000D376FC2|nr:hypothetical protein [Promicromonospora sp. AC04]PUB32540.1 hypothetical protein C8K30_1011066 [Promicromonospora sp. AC04]